MATLSAVIVTNTAVRRCGGCGRGDTLNGAAVMEIVAVAYDIIYLWRLR